MRELRLLSTFWRVHFVVKAARVRACVCVRVCVFVRGCLRGGVCVRVTLVDATSYGRFPCRVSVDRELDGAVR